MLHILYVIILHKEGAKLIVTDINKNAVERAVNDFGAIAVDPDEIYEHRM